MQLKKLANDYAHTKKCYDDEFLTSNTARLQDLLKAKEYRATLLADFVINELDKLLKSEQG